MSGLFVSLVITCVQRACFFASIDRTCVLSAMMLFMLYVVASTLYNRFVLRLRGSDLMPKFTLQHANELLDVSYELLRTLLDRFSPSRDAWRHQRSRNVNVVSHHWTPREEEAAIFAADSLEPSDAALPEDAGTQETFEPTQE